MTTNEFRRVLLEGLRQTQDTRATFYRHQAKIKDIEPGVFLNGLREEYKGLLNHVSDLMPDEFKPYFEGYGDPPKNIIDVFKIIGNIGENKILHSDNIVTLLGEPLNEFEQYIAENQQQPADQRQPRPQKSFTDYLRKDESKKQQFADGLKKDFASLQGKELAILFKAMEDTGHITISNLTALHKSWQRFAGLDIKRDEAMRKAMRKLKDNETVSHPLMMSYSKELEQYKGHIEKLYESIK